MLGHTGHMKEPGTFSMMASMGRERPLVEVLDDLAEKGLDAFVDEAGLGALFLRADDCERMLTDRRFGAVAMPLLSMSGVTEGPLYDLWNVLMFGKDGAEHRRIRTVVSSFFTRAGVERYRAAVTADATALAAALPDNQPFDLWDQLALPLAGRAVCGTIGVPTLDVPTVIGWALDVVSAFSVMSPEEKERAERSAVQFCAYLDELLAGKQNDHSDDLISAILGSPDLTYEEKRGLAANLVFGGLDAMAKAITTGTFQLLERGLWTELAEAMNLGSTAVDELMRFFPPVVALPRVATEPVHYAGVDIAPGQMALASVRSACQDPALFESPTELDLRRRRESRSCSALGRISALVPTWPEW